MILFSTMLFFFLFLIIVFGFLFLMATSSANTVDSKINTCNKVQCIEPVRDPNIEIDLFFQADFKFEYWSVSPVSSMSFVGSDDILILNKNNGTIYRILNGTILKDSLLDVNVANKRERGLLGIANFKDNSVENIFLYFTEAQQNDGTDICHVTWYCEPSTNPSGNRVYKYELDNNRLVNAKLLLNLPATPAPIHNGGVIKVGPDKNLYVVIGDLDGFVNKSSSTRAQNFKNGSNPDGRAGILRITQDGDAVENGILGNEFPMNLYYAYGIRNSFGIDFDPITGNLWDTENGPEYGDEINLVNPGFNSGWNTVQGIWKPIEPKDPNLDFVAGDKLVYPKNLVDFGGKGKYSDPEFIWNDSVGVTDIKFFASDKLGKNYENDLFVASYNLGVIFHFDLNVDRTELKLNGQLKDKIADNNKELEDIIFLKGLGGIVDMEIGPDGYLYVLSNFNNKVTIFKILSAL
jgi:aldose sugar dehydrogenase